MSFAAELRNVSKTFGETRALSNIDLGVREGEVMALLGPNGSGKTTLLKILALIQPPSEGEVYLFGSRVASSNGEQMRMRATMVFQKTVLFDTTVLGNVMYGLKMRKVPKGRMSEKVKEALRLVKLEGFEKRNAKQLSGGEQQRVAFARALAIETKLLLLDEPTANLDPQNASMVEEIIATVNRDRGTTIVMATHNMFQAKRLPTRVGIIDNGKLNDIGGVSEIFGKLSKTLAGFAALENVFKGTASAAENGTCLVDVGNDLRIETASQASGAVSLFVSPDDIILSKSRFASSARNTFRGKIVAATDSGSTVRLKVDVGALFTVHVTRRSFHEMGLNLSSEVFLTFKVSSVQII